MLLLRALTSSTMRRRTTTAAAASLLPLLSTVSLSSSSSAAAFCSTTTTTTTTTTTRRPTAAFTRSSPLQHQCRKMATTGAEMFSAFSQQSQQQQSQSSSVRVLKMVGQDIPLAMESLATADCVCFDVDSTVIDEEGIDVLADSLGQGQAVAELTLAAMEGGMKFQDALAARLNLMQPSKQQILDCLEAHPLKLTDGLSEFVQALQAANKDVYLVSGGFRIMIEPVAEVLNIPKERIFANTILFNEEDGGSYAGFDTTEPTSADMGKPKALTEIQKIGGYQTMVMIGDGATDAQAKPPAKAFVGFGGVARREAVEKAADWFVLDFKDLTKIVTQYAK